MKFHYLIIFLITIYIAYLTSPVLAISKESILGGTPVLRQDYFKYQAVVRGIENNSYEYTLMGGAAILSNHFAISTANIFFEDSGDLRERTFSLLVGCKNLSSSLSYSLQISRIFVPHFDSSFLYFNLVVLELGQYLNFGVNSLVAPVRLPNPEATFQNIEGKVSGFGYYQAAHIIEPDTGIRVIDHKTAVLSSILRSRNVRILSADSCQIWYHANVTDTNICAVIEKNPSVPLTGICYGDIGGPLVVHNDLLVGIASSTTLDCDNTKIGALYMKVAPHVNEIKNFMNNRINASNISPGALIRDNRRYIPPMIG